MTNRKFPPTQNLDPDLLAEWEEKLKQAMQPSQEAQVLKPQLENLSACLGMPTKTLNSKNPAGSQTSLTSSFAKPGQIDWFGGE